MSQMPIFLRAYRRGLRDVQRAVQVYGATRTIPWSSWSAVRVAADWICMPLRKLGYKDVRHLEPDIRRKMSGTSSEETEFVRGYLAGFDEAVGLVEAWGRKMNNPGARDAIAEVVERLHLVRAQMIPDERGRIRTLRSAKFVI